VNGYWGSLIGFFLGFAFGIGCALAVMYSIYMGGYRAAIEDSLLQAPPERLLAARARAQSQVRRDLK
jgi:ABC-type antimicrobial peptide transport system permease subunit